MLRLRAEPGLDEPRRQRHRRHGRAAARSRCAPSATRTADGVRVSDLRHRRRASRPRCGRACSSRSTRPSRRARGPASASTSRTTWWPATGAGSTSSRRRGHLLHRHPAGRRSRASASRRPSRARLARAERGCGAVASSSPARMKTTPSSCSADGASDRIQIPSRTDADRLDGEHDRRDRRRQARQADADEQPADDLDAEREEQQPAVRRPGRDEVDLAERQADEQRDHRRRQRRVEERPGGPAVVGVGAALDEDEAAVGEPGGQAEDARRAAGSRRRRRRR